MDFLSTALQRVKPREDDDLFDRLNYYYTLTVLLLCAVIVSAQQWVGQPIQCWVPAQFTGAWEEYTENYCFVQNTYWWPLDTAIPKEIDIRTSRQIGYYQWVPFILALQAFFFYTPCVIWMIFQSGIDTNEIIRLTASGSMNKDDQNKQHKYIAVYIRECLKMNREHSEKRMCPEKCSAVDLFAVMNKNGCYASAVHLVVKLLYLVNSIGQLFFMIEVLGTKASHYGWQIFISIVQNLEWPVTGNFPRMTLCDFEVRALGNIHRHTVQCVLMVNMFNEKIFTFVWCWTFALCFLNFYSFLKWLLRCLSSDHRINYIEKYIRALEPGDSNDESRRTLKRFVLRHLRQDGVLLIRKLADHGGDVIAAKVAYALYLDYMDMMRTRASLLSVDSFKKLEPPSYFEVDPRDIKAPALPNPGTEAPGNERTKTAPQRNNSSSPSILYTTPPNSVDSKGEKTASGKVTNGIVHHDATKPEGWKEPDQPSKGRKLTPARRSGKKRSTQEIIAPEPVRAPDAGNTWLQGTAKSESHNQQALLRVLDHAKQTLCN